MVSSFIIALPTVPLKRPEVAKGNTTIIKVAFSICDINMKTIHEGGGEDISPRRIRVVRPYPQNVSLQHSCNSCICFLVRREVRSKVEITQTHICDSNPIRDCTFCRVNRTEGMVVINHLPSC